MKFRIKSGRDLSAVKFTGGMLLLATMCAWLAVSWSPPPATAALGDATTLQYALSNTFTLQGTTYTNPANAKPTLWVPPGRGLAVSAEYIGASVNTTGAIGVAFATSLDGVRWCTLTNQYLWHIFNPQGATVLRSFTNFPASVLDNVRYIRLAQITNNNAATNMAAWITNVTASSTW